MITDIWRTHQFVGMIIFSGFFGFWISKKINPLCGVASAYTLISALFIFKNPSSVYPQQIRFDVTSAGSFSEVLILISIIASLTEISKTVLIRIIEVLFLINSFLVLFFGYGMFTSGSMDATFLAMAYPFINFREEIFCSPNYWKRSSILYWGFCTIVPILAIVSVRETTPFITLFAAIGSYFFIETKSIKAILMCFGILLAGYILTGHQFLNPNGRIIAWQYFMDWWRQNANIWVGTGTGTFEWIHNLINHGVPNKLDWLYMHNDYLQILFEQGIIGASLYLMIFISSLWNARKNAWLFGSLSGAAIGMLTQYPLRYFLSQVFILLLIKESQCRSKS